MLVLPEEAGFTRSFWHQQDEHHAVDGNMASPQSWCALGGGEGEGDRSFGKDGHAAVNAG